MRTISTLSVCLSLVAYTFSAAAFERPPAPGQLVHVGGGRRLHMLCKGTADGPTVVFEAGLSQYSASSTYGKAQDAIAPFARVCIYDRAGLGWSDAAPGPRTHHDMVEDLHKLLVAAKIPAPYLLVGHSMGGLLVRQFAQAYRRDVAGVVLLDATSETIYEPGSDVVRAGIVAKIEKGLEKARPGVPVVALPAGTSPDVAMSLTPEILNAVKGEYQAIDRTPAELRGPRGYGTLGDLPLLVVVRRGVTATPPSETDKSWRAEQEQLAALSSNSLLIVAQHSGHVIPYDEPAVVADAVKRVLGAWRRKGKVE